VGERAGEDHRGEDEQRHQHRDHRDPDLHEVQAHERPALTDAVDRVGRAHERAHVAGGRPQRPDQADAEERSRPALRLDHALERAPHGVDRLLARPGLGEDLEDGVDRLRVRAEQPEQGDEHDQPREQREDAVVGERGGSVAEIVLAELLPRPQGGVLPHGAALPAPAGLSRP